MKIRNKTVSVGRLYMCFALQAQGSPLMDKCCTNEKEGRLRKGYGLLIRLPFTGNKLTTGIVIGVWK